MLKYLLDTNVYIDAARDEAFAVRLDEFLMRWLPHTFVSSVVMHELRLGARTPADQRDLDRIEEPFMLRGRLLTPSSSAWTRAATVLRAQRGASIGKTSRAEAADALLACQSRELGLTLVTSDTDFARLQKVVPGLRWSRPFPVA